MEIVWRRSNGLLGGLTPQAVGGEEGGADADEATALEPVEGKEDEDEDEDLVVDEQLGAPAWLIVSALRRIHYHCKNQQICGGCSALIGQEQG